MTDLRSKIEAAIRDECIPRDGYGVLAYERAASRILEIVEEESRPDAPQPFHPPVASALVWQMPREGFNDLAAMLYADVTWGFEPHHSQVSNEQGVAWLKARPTWERGTTLFLERLHRIGHVALEPETKE